MVTDLDNLDRLVVLLEENSPSSGNRDGTVVRALASHQCGPGSIPGLGVICGLGLLLVLVLVRVFFPRVHRFSPLLKNQHFQIPIQSGLLSSTSSRASGSGDCVSSPPVLLPLNNLLYFYCVRRRKNAPLIRI